MKTSHKAQKGNEQKAIDRVRPMTRRQKHKAEKIKKKYGNQDEEERQLRLTLLSANKKNDAGELESSFDTFVEAKEFFSTVFEIHVLIIISIINFININLNLVFNRN